MSGNNKLVKAEAETKHIFAKLSGQDKSSAAYKSKIIQDCLKKQVYYNFWFSISAMFHLLCAWTADTADKTDNEQSCGLSFTYSSLYDRLMSSPNSKIIKNALY